MKADGSLLFASLLTLSYRIDITDSCSDLSGNPKLHPLAEPSLVSNGNVGCYME